MPQVENGGEKFVKPSEAVAELLPEEFSYKPRAQWLEAIEFGKSRRDREEQERKEKEQATQEYRHKEEAAKIIGFASYERSQELARIDNENPGMIDEFIQQEKAIRSRGRHFQRKRQRIQIVGKEELRSNSTVLLKKNTSFGKEASEFHEEILTLTSILETSI